MFTIYDLRTVQTNLIWPYQKYIAEGFKSQNILYAPSYDYTVYYKDYLVKIRYILSEAIVIGKVFVRVLLKNTISALVLSGKY